MPQSALPAQLPLCADAVVGFAFTVPAAQRLDVQFGIQVARCRQQAPAQGQVVPVIVRCIFRFQAQSDPGLASVVGTGKRTE